MSEPEHDPAWAARLRRIYGIAEPMAPDCGCVPGCLCWCPTCPRKEQQQEEQRERSSTN